MDRPSPGPDGVHRREGDARPDPRVSAALRLCVPVPGTYTGTGTRGPVPGPASVVACGICRGPVRPGFSTCFCCATVGRALGHRLAPVVPVSVCAVPGPLHHALWGYKDAVVPEARRHFAAILGPLLDGFVRAHQPCLEVLAGGALGLRVGVPSTRRPGPAPLGALGLVGLSDVLVRARGPLGHLQASPVGYEVPVERAAAVRGARVLVVDDVLTSGARAQSAASALLSCGAAAVVVVVLGRAVRRAAGPLRSRYWDACAGGTFRLERCCLPWCSGLSRARPGRYPAGLP